MPKAEKVCQKLRKYGKVCQKLRKCPKAEKAWQSVPKAKKLRKQVPKGALGAVANVPPTFKYSIRTPLMLMLPYEIRSNFDNIMQHVSIYFLYITVPFDHFV